MEQQQQSKSKQKKTKLFTADTLRLVIFNTTQHHHHRNIAYMEIAWQFFLNCSFVNVKEIQLQQQQQQQRSN